MENNQNENQKGLLQTLAERAKAETPPFFKKLQLIGLALIAAGSVLVAASAPLPEIVVTIGSYLIVAGSVATAVSQVAVKDDGKENN